MKLIVSLLLITITLTVNANPRLDCYHDKKKWNMDQTTIAILCTARNPDDSFRCWKESGFFAQPLPTAIVCASPNPRESFEVFKDIRNESWKIDQTSAALMAISSNPWEAYNCRKEQKWMSNLPAAIICTDMPLIGAILESLADDIEDNSDDD